MLCQDGVCGDSIRVIVKPALGYNLKLQKRLKEKPCVSLFLWENDINDVVMCANYFIILLNLHPNIFIILLIYIILFFIKFYSFLFEFSF